MRGTNVETYSFRIINSMRYIVRRPVVRQDTFLAWLICSRATAKGSWTRALGATRTLVGVGTTVVAVVPPEAYRFQHDCLVMCGTVPVRNHGSSASASTASTGDGCSRRSARVSATKSSLRLDTWTRDTKVLQIRYDRMNASM